MEVRAHGLRVLYQPASTVIHFEHQSYADADAASQSELQKLNSHILYEKWKDVLARDHMPPDTVSHINICHACRSVLPSMLERRRDGHMRVLFLSPYPPKMIRTELLDTLKARGQHVHFALLDSGLHDEEERAALREAWLRHDLSLPAIACPKGYLGSSQLAQGGYGQTDTLHMR